MEMNEETIQLSVSDGSKMSAFMAKPKAEGVHPGLIVFQEAFGVNAHIKDVTRRLAEEGYAAIAPELFHRTAPGFEGSYSDFQSCMPHIKSLTDANLSADIRAAYDALAADKSRVSAIGAIGFCMGGRTAFLAAATVPIKAAVSYYGGGIAPRPEMGNAGLLDRAKDLQCPILLFWGGKDKGIPASTRRSVCDALDAAQKPYINAEFSVAEHGFNCNVRPSYHPQAAAEAWALTLAFLKNNLGI
jgi:carboxymethylenebutenolidase